MDMTPRRWENTCAYLAEVFGRPDHLQASYRHRAQVAGLPDIAVSPDVGRLLMLLTSLANAGRGASVALEVGTLGGYSGIWIARGLTPGGRLYTIESDPRHADFAHQEFRDAGVLDRVTIIQSEAPLAIEILATRLGPDSIDFLFIDAVKKDYRLYLEAAEPSLKKGALVVADNVLGAGWWIDDPPGSSEDRDAMDAFNRWMARNRNYLATCIPIRQGLLVARRI